MVNIGISDKIDALFKAEVDAQTKDIQDKYNESLVELSSLRKELRESKNMIQNMEYIKNQLDVIDQIKSTINNDNFLDFLQLLKLEQPETTLIDQRGRERKEIPTWFEAIFNYYPNKDKVFIMMDLFGIEYPEYAKQFRMPYDYNEDELEYIFNTIGRLSNSNGNNFSQNLRYFFETFRDSKGDFTNEKARFSSYYSIPWQLLLKNQSLIEDRFFNRIIDLMKTVKDEKKRYGNFLCFFAIQEYQEVPQEKIKKLFEFLPNDKFDSLHENFIKRNKVIIKENPTLARSFADKITTLSYSTFYFLNYPLKYQKQYIRTQSTLQDQIKLVQQMNISKEEKIEFINELANDAISS